MSEQVTDADRKTAMHLVTAWCTREGAAWCDGECFKCNSFDIPTGTMPDLLAQALAAARAAAWKAGQERMAAKVCVQCDQATGKWLALYTDIEPPPQTQGESSHER